MCLLVMQGDWFNFIQGQTTNHNLAKYTRSIKSDKALKKNVSFNVYSVILIKRNQKRVRRWQHQYNKVKVFEVEARERKHNNQKLSPCEPKGLCSVPFLMLKKNTSLLNNCFMYILCTRFLIIN